MKTENLWCFILNNNIRVTEVDVSRYEFIYKHQLFGFCELEGRVITPYVKNIHPETGVFEYEPKMWIEEIVQ